MSETTNDAWNWPKRKDYVWDWPKSEDFAKPSVPTPAPAPQGAPDAPSAPSSSAPFNLSRVWGLGSNHLN